MLSKNILIAIWCAFMSPLAGTVEPFPFLDGDSTLQVILPKFKTEEQIFALGWIEYRKYDERDFSPPVVDALYGSMVSHDLGRFTAAIVARMPIRPVQERIAEGLSRMVLIELQATPLADANDRLLSVSSSPDLCGRIVPELLLISYRSAHEEPEKSGRAIDEYNAGHGILRVVMSVRAVRQTLARSPQIDKSRFDEVLGSLSITPQQLDNAADELKRFDVNRLKLAAASESIINQYRRGHELWTAVVASVATWAGEPWITRQVRVGKLGRQDMYQKTTNPKFTAMINTAKKFGGHYRSLWSSMDTSVSALKPLRRALTLWVMSDAILATHASDEALAQAALRVRESGAALAASIDGPELGSILQTITGTTVMLYRYNMVDRYASRKVSR